MKFLSRNVDELHRLCKCTRTSLRSRVALTPGGHGLIKIYHHSRVEKSKISHKQLEKVAMNEAHRILELRLISKGQDVIEVLNMELLAATISVPCY